MTRPLRIEFPGAFYHVMSRGNEKQEIFADSFDRVLFFDILGEVKRRCGWECHAYCLMGNHYHLLIETPEGRLIEGMRQLNGVYAQAFNRRHDRVGHLLQGRYQSPLIDSDEYFLKVSRYIVGNPVRSGLVKKPEEWEWSSCRATTGSSSACLELLNTELTLGMFSDNITSARLAYRGFVDAGLDEGYRPDEYTYCLVVGWETVPNEAIEELKSKRGVIEYPKDHRFAEKRELSAIFGGDMDIQTRNMRVREAYELDGYSQTKIAAYLGLHPSAISKICRVRS